jgi:hypothetical protein
MIFATRVAVGLRAAVEKLYPVLQAMLANDTVKLRDRLTVINGGHAIETKRERPHQGRAALENTERKCAAGAFPSDQVEHSRQRDALLEDNDLVLGCLFGQHIVQ